MKCPAPTLTASGTDSQFRTVLNWRKRQNISKVPLSLRIMKNPKQRAITVYLPNKATHAKAKAKAKAQNRSLTGYVCELIRVDLEKKEN